MTIEHTPDGTPYLSDQSYLSETPPYTQELVQRIDELAARLDAGGGGASMPPGVVMPYMGWHTEVDELWNYHIIVKPPDGWLLCDGRAYDETYFSELYEACPAFHGGEEGSFRVPDLRGRTLVGATPPGDPDWGWQNQNLRPTRMVNPGDRGGDWRLQRHMHYIEPTPKSNAFSPSGGDDWYCTFTPNGSGLIDPPEKHKTTYNIPHEDGAYGIGENMPPFTGINFIVYTGKPTLDENGDILPECGQGEPITPRTTRGMIEDRLAAAIDEEEIKMLKHMLDEVRREASE